MGQRWQFISSNQSGGKFDDSSARKTVRENAMRVYRRNQRLQMIRELQQKRAKDPGIGPSRLIARADATAGRSSSSSHSPQSRQLPEAELGMRDSIPTIEIGYGPRFNPFASTALSRQEARMLFSHFICNIVPIIQPFHLRSDQSPLSTVLAACALRDPISVEAILFHAAVHLDHLHGRESSPLTIYHRGQLIHLINVRLETSEDVASDELILAVGLLGSTGNITGDVADDVVHKKALGRMIRMRGGFKNLGHQGTLAMITSIGDLISAAIAGSELISSRPHIDPVESGPLKEVAELLLTLEPWLSTSDMQTTRFKIRELINLLARLTSIYTTSYTPLRATSADMVTFTQLCCAVDHHLLSIKLPDKLAIAQDPDIFIYNAARSAALMFSTYVFRVMRPCGAVFTSLQADLQDNIVSLKALNGATLEEDCTKLLLWAVCVGAVTSYDPQWYAEPLNMCLSLLDFRGWGDLIECLEDYLWIPRMYTNQFVALFGTIQNVKAS